MKKNNYMMRYFLLFCFLSSTLSPMYAQIFKPEDENEMTYRFGCYDDLINIPMSSEHNGIVDITYRSRDGHVTSTKVQYFDGLGRLVENINVGASPSGEDVVVWHEYDGNGKRTKTWLPAVMNYSGNMFHPYNSVNQMSVASNSNDSYPYEELFYEDNPQARVIERFGPGADWRANNKSVKTEYLTNVADDEELNCVKFVIALNSNNVRRLGDYPTGKLRVTKTTNEDGEVSLEFRDNMDRIILSRHLMQYGDKPLDTYYVYDGLNLRYVFPPKASEKLPTGSISTSFLNSNAYIYKYDKWNRMVSKKMPGSNAVFMAYDLADRLVFSQDGVQRQNGKCTFHLYDVYGRECVMGECTKILSASGNEINDYVRCDYTKDGPFMGYTLSGTDIDDSRILMVNYYDSYDYLDDDSLRYVDDKTFGLMHDHPRGLRTGNVTARLGDSLTYDTSAFYYDEYSRMIQSNKTNHLGGYDHEFIEYDFPGDVLRRKLVHSRSGYSPIVQVYQNTYDNEGRLLRTTHSINGQTAVTLAEYEYDEQGRLRSNKRNGRTGMTTTYDYNLRSWLASVSSNVFTENISYNIASPGVTPRYDGNISGITEIYTDNGSQSQNRYSFIYDMNSRLQNAQHSNSLGNDVFSTSYEFDPNGNVTHVLRNGFDAVGEASLIDDLTIEYTGDRLKKVTNAAPAINLYNSMHFSDGADVSPEYSYDVNGNLIKDLNRKISLIQYNILNLPKKKSFSNGAFEEMIYSANGEKLQVRKKNIAHGVGPGTGGLAPDPNLGPSHVKGTANKAFRGTPVILPDYSVTDYCGNIVYKDGQLSRISVDGGYVTFGNNGVPDYHFYLTDHLGSNRMVLSSEGVVEQQNFYYPFGASRSDCKNKGQSQPYKYNGKELDSYENIFSYDYSARLYDPILCRFMQPDPLAEKYYSISPYAYCFNDPVNKVDPDGRDVLIWYQDKYGNNHSFLYNGTQIMVPNDCFVLDFLHTYHYLKENNVGDNIVNAVINPSVLIELQKADVTMYQNYDRRQTVFWEPRKGLLLSNGERQSPAIRLEHEFDHAMDDLENHKNHLDRKNISDVLYDNKEERRVITGSETKTARKLRQGIRTNHSGETYMVTDPRVIK